MLNSPLFSIWSREQGADLLAALRSYPFPWPPGTPLGSLSRGQEEHRQAIAKAARNGDGDAVNAAVLHAYGWRDEGDKTALLGRLRVLHAARLR